MEASAQAVWANVVRSVHVVCSSVANNSSADVQVLYGVTFRVKMRKYSGEVWGAGLETLGLLVLLIAAAFQAYVADWFPKQDTEAVVYTETIVHRAQLLALDEMNSQLAVGDPALRKYQNESAGKRLREAYSATFDEDKRRRALRSGQGALFANIRFFLFAAGALLIVLGKGLTFRHKMLKERASAPPI